MSNDFTPSQQPDSPWRLASRTRAGRLHLQHGRCNEDAVRFRVCQGGTVALAVADGVGGGQYGDKASAAVAQHWVTWPVAAHGDDVQVQASQALRASEAALRRALPGSGDHAGSMLVGVWAWPDGGAIVGHVGDCRAYRYQRDCLSGLTRDHSYGNLGLRPPTGGLPEHPARMVGGGMLGPPDVQRLRLEPGDVLLLSSDGVHGWLDDGHIQDCLRTAFARQGGHSPEPLATLERVAVMLVRQARQAGSTDDISVVLGQFLGSGVADLATLNQNACDATPQPPSFSDSVWPMDV